MAIQLEYVKVAQYTKDTTCPHNEAVTCERKNCRKCGWNPNVAKRRLEKITGKLKEANHG